jgi:two-component system NtrC family sensor kinase
MRSSVLQCDGCGRVSESAIGTPSRLGPQAGRGQGARTACSDTVGGRAVLNRQIVHVEDLQAADSDFPEGAEYARQLGQRAQLAVPLLREGVAIGVLQVRRAMPIAYTDAQTALLQTFADQAVIAIENVRLFNETKEALEQQTATGEILGAIASSPTDVEPVFHTIVESAVRLCGASLGAMYHYDGRLVRFGAHHGYTPTALELVHGAFPAPAERTTLVGLTILSRQVVHVPDYDTEGDIPDVRQPPGSPLRGSPVVR